MMSDDRLLLYIEFGMGWAGVDGLLYVLTGLIGLAVNRAGPGRHYVPHHRPEHGMRNKPYWPGQDVDRVVPCSDRVKILGCIPAHEPQTLWSSI